MKEPEEIKKQRCPDCGSTDTVRHGFNLTKKCGNKARRKCKKCATTFYEQTEDKK